MQIYFKLTQTYKKYKPVSKYIKGDIIIPTIFQTSQHTNIKTLNKNVTLTTQMIKYLEKIYLLPNDLEEQEIPIIAYTLRLLGAPRDKVVEAIRKVNSNYTQLVEHYYTLKTIPENNVQFLWLLLNTLNKNTIVYYTRVHFEEGTLVESKNGVIYPYFILKIKDSKHSLLPTRIFRYNNDWNYSPFKRFIKRLDRLRHYKVKTNIGYFDKESVEHYYTTIINLPHLFLSVGTHPTGHHSLFTFHIKNTSVQFHHEEWLGGLNIVKFSDDAYTHCIKKSVKMGKLFMYCSMNNVYYYYLTIDNVCKNVLFYTPISEQTDRTHSTRLYGKPRVSLVSPPSY